jgi:hypothetical protein
MTSTPVLVESTRREAEVRVSAPLSLTLGRGILLIVGAAATWNIALVLIHDLTTRLLR